MHARAELAQAHRALAQPVAGPAPLQSEAGAQGLLAQQQLPSLRQLAAEQ